MNTFVFVVCIVAIVMIADTVQKYMKLQHKKQADSQDVDETMRQIEALEDRIKVLERIVTESKYDLKKEIDKL